jgi:hypothetical protein
MNNKIKEEEVDDEEDDDEEEEDEEDEPEEEEEDEEIKLLEDNKEKDFRISQATLLESEESFPSPSANSNSDTTEKQVNEDISSITNSNSNSKKFSKPPPKSNPWNNIRKTEFTQAKLGREMTFQRQSVTDQYSLFDYCLVFDSENVDNPISDFAQSCLEIMKSNGLDLAIFRSKVCDKLFVLVRAPIDLVREYAESNNFKLLLDADVLRETANHGNIEKGIKPIDIPHNADECEVQPYDYIYAKYTRKCSEELFWRKRGGHHPFNGVARLKITRMIIEARSPQSGIAMNIPSLILSGKLVTCYPLHNIPALEDLKMHWLPWNIHPWEQPYEQIKVRQCQSVVV